MGARAVAISRSYWNGVTGSCKAKGPAGRGQRVWCWTCGGEHMQPDRPHGGHGTCGKAKGVSSIEDDGAAA
eukprot:4741754-Prorocentrum_lima.AAC.1